MYRYLNAVRTPASATIDDPEESISRKYCKFTVLVSRVQPLLPQKEE